MARGLANFSPSALRAYRTNIYARPGVMSMTAEELAQAVGATKAQILAYENGHRVPDPPRLKALGQALGIHPSELMERQAGTSWDVADVRRACGLRAQDVVDALGVSPKNYRRFENEGIVPSRRPRFLDEVAALFHVTRVNLERAINRTPAVQKRQERAAELVTVLAGRYVSMPGEWKGPASDDRELIELAAAYGRPVQRTRRVLTYELGELRQRQVRAERERVIADYDTDRDRQANARLALHRWGEMYERKLSQIPLRLEKFHRNAQPSNIWQLLVDLHDADAAASQRGEPSFWAVARLLSDDYALLPAHLVEHRSLETVPICRLTMNGVAHVASFSGLYAELYPGVRRPLRGLRRSANPKARSHHGVEAFSLPNHPERLVVPSPALEMLRSVAGATKGSVAVDLSPRMRLTVGLNSLTAAPPAAPVELDFSRVDVSDEDRQDDPESK
ncbi:helix-turn-helix transcriptional regulator [Streptomyces sp. NPDC057302]|uniref:helix-turn-helix transcriptional regulator n=1 Tax=Streptomyces sp. NPDC057302 TaxID=3346094 RepID=UPI003632A1F1